jgi:hypothetical protein
MIIDHGPFITEEILYDPNQWRIARDFVRTLNRLKAIDSDTYISLDAFLEIYDGYYDLDDSWDNDWDDEEEQILNDLLDKK